MAARIEVYLWTSILNKASVFYKKKTQQNKTNRYSINGPDVLDLIFFLLILSHQGQGQTNKESQTNAISERKTTQTVIKETVLEEVSQR